MISVLKVLNDRGFIQQCTDIDELDVIMAQKSITFYEGVDPTGISLHVGHLIPYFAISHLQRAGHKAIALIGGGTAKIGDPTGKNEMRKMLSDEQIELNINSIKKQLSSIIKIDGDFNKIINNNEWLGKLNYLELLREIGPHFSVNKMLSFETYKKRYETNLNFIEFNYQILQSYDFLNLYKEENAILQIGGDDQWGNIVAGVDLIRRVTGEKAYGMTFPLITTSDGKKMGKTEKGALFLNPNLVSPFEFYSYFREVTDSDVGKFLKLFTFRSLSEIDNTINNKDYYKAKKILAFDFTSIIHGEENAIRSEQLYQKK